MDTQDNTVFNRNLTTKLIQSASGVYTSSLDKRSSSDYVGTVDNLAEFREVQAIVKRANRMSKKAGVAKKWRVAGMARLGDNNPNAHLYEHTRRSWTGNLIKERASSFRLEHGTRFDIYLRDAY